MRSQIKRKPVTLSDRPTVINSGNMVSKLRRIRTELALMLAQVDEALERIEEGR